MTWKDQKTWIMIWSLFASEVSHVLVGYGPGDR